MKKDEKYGQINATNYEAYLLDYFEGNISELQTTELHHFLNQNPDLKVDWEGFESIALKADSTTFEDKRQLYRSTNDSMGLMRQDYLLAKQIEEKLTEVENEELTQILYTSPHLLQEVKLMANTRLAPGSELFAAKNRIKRIALLPMLTQHRLQQVAAITILLLMTTSLWMVNPFEKTDRAVVSSVKTNVIHNNKPMITESINEPETATMQSEPHIQKPSIENKVDILQQQAMKRPKQNREAEQLMKPLISKEIELQKNTPSINAYELGVNHMMPTYVALLQNNNKPNQNEPAASSTRTLSILQGSIKVLNALSGNDIKLEKELDDTGNVVAFTVQTETAIINKQLRQ